MKSKGNSAIEQEKFECHENCVCMRVLRFGGTYHFLLVLKFFEFISALFLNEVFNISPFLSFFNILFLHD